MFDVPVIKGYITGTEISRTGFFSLCRAVRESDSLPVLLRLPVKGSDMKRSLEMLERDFHLAGNSSVRGTLPVQFLERSADSAAAVIGDSGWIPLASVTDSAAGLFAAAVEIARTLALVHSSGIIHRNLHSASFMFIKGDKIKCAVYGLEHSARISDPAGMEKNVPRTELEIATASPEMLGLIPFVPDYRSDLYSLGIIFYEMFTGLKPFQCHDQDDLIYSHIAREPVPPSLVSRDVPPRISDIIMKLLMKDPDCRYQNVTELIDDLELCRYLYENLSADTTPSSRILHPLFTDRIYGRDEEMLKCMRIFESAKNGRFRIILTGGPPGSGKTCFVTKFMTGASRYGGLQGCSKDNRHGSNIPYSGIAAAFGHVIRQILTRSDSEISAWRERFIEALGANLSLITEIIPGLEIITGPQTGQPGSGDIETLNRFLISFRKFAQTLARHAGPLVIFLDDIQWSDRAGLALVKSLACDHDLKHILLICAYRDNEIVPGDTLSDFLGEMKCNPEQVEFIKIGGLPDRDAVEMIEDIIQIPGGGCPELCGYIYRKTAGNPYYIREYIKTVFTGGLLKIFSGGRAEYDIAGMDMLPASESLASVLNSAMLNLPREMKNILAAGACAGWAFSPHLVAAILRVPVASVNACLDYLAEQGYIVRTDDGCRFVHDRVRETAYELIPESERLAIHRRSGRILFGMAGNDAETFYAVEQINLARDIITDGKELTDLSLLNFEAGLISQKIAAFAPALAYFRRAAELLPDDSWNCCYELTAGILKELTRCESVNGNTARAERIVLESLEHLNSPEEKVEFIILLIHQMNIKGRFSEAVELCLHALGLMGVEVPLNEIEKETYAEMNCLNDYLACNGINALTGLKKNNDSRHILIIKILLQLGWPAYFIDKALMVYVSLKMMNLTIQYGLSRETIAVCCSYIGVTASVFGDYETAFSLWKTTAVIMENLNDRYYEAEICLKAANYVVPMIMHLRESEPVNLAGYNAGYLSGEHLCSGYIIAHKTVNSFHYGKELGHILSEIDDDIEFNLRTQNFLASEVMLSLKKVIICLAGDVKGLSPNIRGDDPGIWDNLFPRINDNDVILSQVGTFSIQAFFMMAEYAKCLEIIDSIKDKVGAMHGLFTATEFNFYHSLSLSSMINDVDKATAGSYRKEIILNQLAMKEWSERCPENFLHKYLLVQAELSGLDGNITDAMNYYDRAISSAGENKYIQNEALCNELAARFWFSRGKEEFAGIYLRKARRLYSEWGALRKVRMIDWVYPALIRIRSRSGGYDSDDLTVINRESAAVVRSLQAISGEIEFDSLLHTLTSNILQFSGATRLVFMMEEAGMMCVGSEGSLNSPEGSIKSELLHSVPLDTYHGVPLGVIRYCRRTGDTVIVNDGTADEMFQDDPYIAMNMPKSYICVKNNYGDTTVMTYLENSVARYAFTTGKVDVLKLISVQAAISLENARLYREKKESVKKLAELGEIRDTLLKQYDEAQQRAMQKRMDPHFLYNAIHTIHSLININPAEADRAVLLLGEMLHFFTDRSFERLVAFNDEWRFIQLYLEFEKIRFPDTLWFFLEKKYSFDGIMIPPLTIQPLVENAIKHGLRKKSGGGIVNITAYKMDDLAVIEVRDTGIGLNTDDLYSRSIGNIINRLKYNFDFADVTLSSRENGGVKVTVKFTARNK